MRAWLELARVSNLPTCVSNVLVGAAIGGVTCDIAWPVVGVVMIAVMLFYVGGMTLNDVVDHRIDLRERPGRPIPSGRIPLRAAAVVAFVCLVAGAGLTAFAGRPAVWFGIALAAVIVVYDLVHKRAAASVVLMGACRGLVYLTAAAAVCWPLDWPVATILTAAITVYVALVTVLARAEAATPRIRVVVLRWLAGISLVDAIFLVLLGRPVLAAVALGCLVVTAWGHRRILGT